MTVSLNDVCKCLDTLESGEEFIFVFEKDRFRPYRGEGDNIENILVILTPEWYNLTYCSNDWNDLTFKNELVDFHNAMKKLNGEFISTKFTVVWR
jgi:hypothetical protein